MFQLTLLLGLQKVRRWPSIAPAGSSYGRSEGNARAGVEHQIREPVIRRFEDRRKRKALLPFFTLASHHADQHRAALTVVICCGIAFTAFGQTVLESLSGKRVDKMKPESEIEVVTNPKLHGGPSRSKCRL